MGNENVGAMVTIRDRRTLTLVEIKDVTGGSFNANYSCFVLYLLMS